MSTRTITIDPVTRLEGHGKIEILLDDHGDVAATHFQVPELRGFERFCVGRPAEEMPRITSRICGVCPAAHHIASAHALDALYGVEPPVAAHKIRELYYNLFLFEDHLLHFYFLGGPDFVMGPKAGKELRNVLGVIGKLGVEVGRTVIAIRKEARDLMAAMCGRITNPVFALPGGISQPLDPAVVARARAASQRFVDFALSSLDLFKELVLDDPKYLETILGETYRHRTHSMGLVDADGSLSFTRGHIRVVDPAGAEVAAFAAADYLEHVAEHVEPWSYMKFPFLRARGWTGFQDGADSGIYRVGPLARLNVCARMATPRAEEHRQAIGAALGGFPLQHTLAFHWARLIEVLQAAETVQRLARDPEIGSRDVRALPTREPREGVGVVEAPRGTLLHHYKTDERGILTFVNLIVATQNNAGAIQLSVSKAAKTLIRGGHVDDGLLNMVEMAFRAYDPCFACASHSLPGEMPLSVEVRAADGQLVWAGGRGPEPGAARG